jgi:hypothetical protein
MIKWVETNSGYTEKYDLLTWITSLSYNRSLITLYLLPRDTECSKQLCKAISISRIANS